MAFKHNSSSGYMARLLKSVVDKVDNEKHSNRNNHDGGRNDVDKAALMF